jgi:hypothetical protein
MGHSIFHTIYQVYTYLSVICLVPFLTILSGAILEPCSLIHLFCFIQSSRSCCRLKPSLLIGSNFFPRHFSRCSHFTYFHNCFFSLQVIATYLSMGVVAILFLPASGPLRKYLLFHILLFKYQDILFTMFS